MKPRISRDVASTVDVVLLTALPEERAAVEDVFAFLKNTATTAKDGVAYLHGKLAQDDGRVLSIVLLAPSGMGTANAAILATRAIDVWDPQYVILCGIAGGVEGKTPAERTFGDIIVAEQIVAYEPGKIEGGAVTRRFETYRPALDLVSAAKQFAYDWKPSLRVAPPKPVRKPAVHFGVVASGDKVVADSTAVAELRQHWAKLAGIEMEGHGVAAAAYAATAYSEHKAPGMLLVKAISDFADANKNDGWRQYAAHTAAVFVHDLLQQATIPARSHGTAIRASVSADPSLKLIGKNKLCLCKGLNDDWEDLADYFDIPIPRRRRFKPGRECQGIWEYLEERERLDRDTLDDGLTSIGRDDLKRCLQDEVSPLARSTVDARNLVRRPAVTRVGASQERRAVQPERARPPAEPRPGLNKKHVILFLAANPQMHDPLRLAEECADIQRELKMSPHRDDFQFESRWAVSIDELMRHLNELSPTVIHFAGHGAGKLAGSRRSSGKQRDIVVPGAGSAQEDGIYLQDEQGLPQRLSARALAMMIAAAGVGARVVVLNACYTAAQADVLRTKVDCVVGMDGGIADDAARAFAIRFYGALGSRRSVGNAVDQGVAALAAKQMPDELLPRCVTRDGIDKYQVFLDPSSPRPHRGRRGRGRNPRG